MLTSSSKVLFIITIIMVVISCAISTKKTIHHQIQKQPYSRASGIQLENINQKIRPQDDFYQYVNGAWLNKTVIPEDKSSYGSFTVLRNKSNADLRKIIDQISQQPNAKLSTENKKIKNLYASFMNIEKRNQLGISPLIKISAAS